MEFFQFRKDCTVADARLEMSIYPLVNPDRYGPNLGNASSAGSTQAKAFKKLEQFLEKNPHSANQEYKQTFFFEDLSICFQCILTTPEDKEVRPLHAMFLFNFGYPLSGADFVEGVKLLGKINIFVFSLIHLLTHVSMTLISSVQGGCKSRLQGLETYSQYHVP